MSISKKLCCVLVGGLVSVSEPCFAQDAAAAEGLFRSAREAAERGDWVTACDRFEASRNLEPAPGTVLNLARCREKLGQIASAWKLFEEAAQRLPPGDDRATFARSRATALAPRVPHLVLTAPEQGTGLRVFVGETELQPATFGVALPFDPGPLTVTVKAPGRVDHARTLILEEGQRLEFQVEAGAKQKPVAQAPGPLAEVPRLPEPARASSSRTVGYVALGVGGLGAVGLSIGAVWAATLVPKVKDNCDGDQCNTEGAAAASSGRTAVAVMGVSSAISLLGLGVGTYLLLSSGKETSLSVAPVVGGALVNWSHDL
jgi:hypothetical protein